MSNRKHDNRRRISENDRNDNRTSNYRDRSKQHDRRDSRDSHEHRDNRDKRDTSERYRGKDAREQITINKNSTPANNQNNKTVEKSDDGPKDTELFIGAGPYLRTENQIVECRDGCLYKPNSMFFYEVKSSNFPTKALPETMKCRSVLLDFDVTWYSDFFDENGKITDKKKQGDAIDKITSDIALVVKFYKPARTFLQIFDAAEDRDSDFGASLAWISYKEGYILIDFNAVGKSSIADAPDDQKIKIWRGRIKYALKDNKPKDRELTSPTKGINCNEIVKR